MVEKKEFRVFDIQPEGYTIRIVDAQQNPIVGVEFNVSWDGGEATARETDEKGIISISKPSTGISVTLIVEKESTSNFLNTASSAPFSFFSNLYIGDFSNYV